MGQTQDSLGRSTEKRARAVVGVLWHAFRRSRFGRNGLPVWARQTRRGEAEAEACDVS